MRKKTKENLKNQRLGDILKSLNLLDDKTLEQLLERQRHSNLKFGEVLSLMGCVDQEIVLSILGKQLGHPYVKVSEHCPLDMEVLKYIPKCVAEAHKLIPFEKTGRVLKIAMTDPQEEEVRAAIALLTNLEVEAYITSEEEIIEAIEENY